MEPRLATSIFVSGLIRRAESEGGTGMVLAKGDETAGAILIILNEKGRKQRILERVLQPGGQYLWQDNIGQDIDNDAEISALLARRRSFDPDLWLIELDVASAERFAAEMNSAR
ncbi:MAG TPA: DUF1491 family protein [Allosphingosinicella sp.]|uniref:DUF1491 family protein n=1 Tax=Allosphingosinicella sp. TaxID=2823234 RepID=UPI002EDAF940